MAKNLENNTDSVAEKIWNSIKGKKVEMFALPDQYVHMYCEPIPIEPSKLYLKFRVPAILPALEEAVKNTHKVERMDKYIVVTEV